MLLRNVFTKSIWDARRSLPGWTFAITAVALMYAAFWPSIHSPAMADALKAYPRGALNALNAGDMTTAQGYLGGAVYGLLVPLLVAVFMIAVGARSLAGDEEAGTLDLVLAHPVSRLRLAAQRFAGLLVQMAAVPVVLFAVLVLLRGAFGLDSVSVGGLFAINLQLTMFGVVFGALAFAIGAATGSRSTAFTVGTGVAVLAYFGNSVSPWHWTRELSVFHWYLGGEPLTNGVQWGGVTALVVTAAVLAAAGTVLFTRRDVTT